jgi:hypothetical protein
MGSLIVFLEFSMQSTDENVNFSDTNYEPKQLSESYQTSESEFIGNDNPRSTSSTRTSRANQDQEPNNSMATASIITYTSHVRFNGTLSSTDTVDWYTLQLSKGDSSATNPDHFAIALQDISTGTGVSMQFLSPNSKPPYPHKLAISEVHDFNNPDPNASSAIIEMVPPLDGWYFLRVLPNGVANGNYTLDFYKTTETSNAGYDGDNSFASPRWVDPNVEKTYIPNEYLDPIWDIHDFYNFTGYENQTLEVELTLPSTADYDIFLFDKQSVNPIDSSTNVGFGIGEKISTTLTENNVYYIRVWAKVNGSVDHINNYGWYSIHFKGNVPPVWRTNATDYYEVEEDHPPFYIEEEPLWMDPNKNDQIDYILWDYNKEEWAPRDDNEVVVSSLKYDNFEIQIINNGTITVPDEAIKVILTENAYGETEVRLGARDRPAEAIGQHNITINIKQLNDKPVLNNTLKWIRFMPDGLTIKNNRIIATEESSIKIQATAYDVDGDNIAFTDNTNIFDIDPDSGMISFYAPFKLIGTHEINITVTDDGANPDLLSSTNTVEFIIKDSGIDHKPKTYLHVPENRSLIKSLFPNLAWNATDFDSSLNEITYNVFFSDSFDKVNSLDKSVMILNGTNSTSYTFTTPLLDKKTYYWTVIPFDGIFTGSCRNGFFKFRVDTEIIAPEVVLLTPKNQSILNYTDVELTWSIQYEGDQDVISDIYLGISDTDLKLMEQGYDGTSYFPDDIFNGHVYYWKIVPKAGVPPNRISGDDSQIYNFEVKRGYKPPNVKLISPDDRSIFKSNEVSLSWEVDYRQPQKVTYEIYLETTIEFGAVPFQIVTETFLKLEDLTATKYYWKVIPMVGEVPGPASEIRWFKIDPTVVQPIVVPKYPKANSTINITWVQLQWTVEYSGSIPKVRYDVYLDNSTDYRPGMSQINNNYRQFFVGVQLDDNKTYYWYVLPSIETVDGFIVGEFQGGLSRFTVDTSYRPPPEPEFELSLDPTTIKIQPGNITEIDINLKNTGNVGLSVDVTYEVNPNDVLFINLIQQHNIFVAQGSVKTIKLTVTAPTTITEKTGVGITVQGEIEEFTLSDRDVLTVEVEPKRPDEDPDNNASNGTDNFIIIALIAIIIICIFLSLLMIIRRRKKIKEQEEEAAARAKEKLSKSRIALPSPTPYSTPTPVTSVSGYKPPEAIPSAPAAAVITPVAKPSAIKPVKPVRPVTPIAGKTIKPITPVAAKPVKPVSVGAKPVKPMAAKPVTPVPGGAKPVKPMAAKPVTPLLSGGKPLKPIAAKPVTPISSGAKPVKPITAVAAKPVTPISSGAKPVTPIAAKPVTPVPGGVKPVTPVSIESVKTEKSKKPETKKEVDKPPEKLEKVETDKKEPKRSKGKGRGKSKDKSKKSKGKYDSKKNKSGTGKGRRGSGKSGKKK